MISAYGRRKFLSVACRDTSAAAKLLLVLLCLPSTSISLIMSCSSFSVGFCPRDLITVPSSAELIVPSRFLSNRLNASRNSSTAHHQKLIIIIIIIMFISCFFFGQLSVSFLGPCCPAPLYCIAVHACLMLIERINDDDVICSVAVEK